MKLMESTLPGMYSKSLFEEKCLDLAPEHTDKMFDILLTATANILNHVKSIERPAAYCFRSVDKSFIAGALVQYFPNEDANNPGNWSLVWTFDEADIPENALKLSLSDADTQSYFIAVAGEKYGIQYRDEASIINCLTYVLIQLRKWLDKNAKESSEVKIEMDGFFQARVTVENGVKVFAMEPAGEIKNLIKDDAAIEK